MLRILQVNVRLAGPDRAEFHEIPCYFPCYQGKSARDGFVTDCVRHHPVPDEILRPSHSQTLAQACTTFRLTIVRLSKLTCRQAGKRNTESRADEPSPKPFARITAFLVILDKPYGMLSARQFLNVSERSGTRA